MKKVISNLKAAMKNAGLFLIIQSILYILLAGLLIAAVIGIYKDGAALRAEDPLAAIFSREIAAKALRKIAPAFFGAVGITEQKPYAKLLQPSSGLSESPRQDWF